MAAVKRIADIRQKGATNCLNCGREMPRDKMKDNTIYQCVFCGYGHIIDRAGNMLTLTAKERADVRRRIQDAQAKEPDERDARIALLERELKDARQQAKEWEAAADGLARMVEDLKLKYGEISGAREKGGSRRHKKEREENGH